MQLGYTVRILSGARATSIDGNICVYVYILYIWRYADFNSVHIAIYIYTYIFQGRYRLDIIYLCIYIYYIIYMGVNRTGQPDLQTIFHLPITFHHMTTMDIFIYI